MYVATAACTSIAGVAAWNPTLAAIAAVGLAAFAGEPVRSTILPVDEFSPSVIFYDDFEDGGLAVDDVPPGKWDGVIVKPGTDAGVSPLAALAGNRGLRIDDAVDVPDPGTTVGPYVALAADAGTSDRYLRAWVRVTETADAGTVTILQFLHGPRSVADVNLTFPPGGILLAGDTADGGYPVYATGYQIGGAWRLLEVAVLDAGTGSTTRVLWLDTLVAGQQRINQQGWTVDELDIGEPWADVGTFQGSIDFDNVAVTTDPPPSHVEIDAGTNGLAAGVCRPVGATLMSSWRVPAGALRPDRLNLTVDVDGGAAVALYTDPNCADAGSTIDIDAGTTDVAFGIVGLAPGSLDLSVSSFDLLGYPINRTVLGVVDAGTPDAGTDAGSDGGNAATDAGADAGSDAGTVEDAGHDAGDGTRDGGGDVLPPENLAVCGCGAAGGPWSAATAAALLALALWLRRSAARPARPPPPGRGRSGRRSRTARCGG